MAVFGSYHCSECYREYFRYKNVARCEERCGRNRHATQTATGSSTLDAGLREVYYEQLRVIEEHQRSAMDTMQRTQREQFISGLGQQLGVQRQQQDPAAQWPAVQPGGVIPFDASWLTGQTTPQTTDLLDALTVQHLHVDPAWGMPQGQTSPTRSEPDHRTNIYGNGEEE